MKLDRDAIEIGIIIHIGMKIIDTALKEIDEVDLPETAKKIVRISIIAGVFDSIQAYVNHMKEKKCSHHI